GRLLRPGGGDRDERQASYAFQCRRVGLPVSGRADQPETHCIPPLAASRPVANIDPPAEERCPTQCRGTSEAGGGRRESQESVTRPHPTFAVDLISRCSGQ